MGVVHQVYHLDEAVIVGVGRRDTSLLVQREHALEEVNELATVETLRHQLAAFQLRRYVDLDRRQYVRESTSTNSEGTYGRVARPSAHCPQAPSAR